MKKMFVLLALVSSLATASEDWVFVVDSTDGVRLLIDSTSFLVSTDKTTKNKQNNPFYVGARFKYVDPVTGDGTPFAFVQNVNTCIANHGEILYREYQKGKWATAGRYWWDSNGTKMYDTAGQLLCEVLKEQIKLTRPAPTDNGDPT